MGFLQDDEYNALAIQRLCDALDERIDATQQQQHVDKARKLAQMVTDRNRNRKQDSTPAEPEEGQDQ